MAAMAVSEPPRGQEEQRRTGFFHEPVTRPQGLIKEGATGTRIEIVSNAYKMETRPNFMIYQYNVAFSPEVDFKKVRFGLIKEQEQLLGCVRAFDGMTMFLPKKLPDPITKIIGIRKRRDNPEGEPVEITITLTNELPEYSPTSLQLYNIILRRYTK
jgi:aubergine-like protein